MFQLLGLRKYCEYCRHPQNCTTAKNSARWMKESSCTPAGEQELAVVQRGVDGKAGKPLHPGWHTRLELAGGGVPSRRLSPELLLLGLQHGRALVGLRVDKDVQTLSPRVKKGNRPARRGAKRGGVFLAS